LKNGHSLLLCSVHGLTGVQQHSGVHSMTEGGTAFVETAVVQGQRPGCLSLPASLVSCVAQGMSVGHGLVETELVHWLLLCVSNLKIGQRRKRWVDWEKTAHLFMRAALSCWQAVHAALQLLWPPHAPFHPEHCALMCFCAIQCHDASHGHLHRSNILECHTEGSKYIWQLVRKGDGWKYWKELLFVYLACGTQCRCPPLSALRGRGCAEVAGQVVLMISRTKKPIVSTTFC
jgi:hypothetical protein